MKALPSTMEHMVIQTGRLYAAWPLSNTMSTPVVTGIPIAYPRMVFLETALDSKLNPLVALGRNGSMGLSGFVNKFNADAELLDDLVSILSSSSLNARLILCARTTTGLPSRTRRNGTGLSSRCKSTPRPCTHASASYRVMSIAPPSGCSRRSSKRRKRAMSHRVWITDTC